MHTAYTHSDGGNSLQLVAIVNTWWIPGEQCTTHFFENHSTVYRTRSTHHTTYDFNSKPLFRFVTYNVKIVRYDDYGAPFLYPAHTASLMWVWLTWIMKFSTKWDYLSSDGNLFSIFGTFLACMRMCWCLCYPCFIVLCATECTKISTISTIYNAK